MAAILTPMTEVAVQRQAKALGDPTRFAIFSWISEQVEPVTIIALKDQFGLNHTTIRQHVLQLCDAGLVLESQAPPTGPGRPKRLYEVAPGARGVWTQDGPYERVALLLLEVLRTGKSPREVGVAHGARRQGARTSSGDPIDAMAAEVQREGFAPVVDRQGQNAELTLTVCPFANVASGDPDIVCALHRGLAEGLAASVGGVEVSELVARLPSRAGCKLRLALSEQPTS